MLSVDRIEHWQSQGAQLSPTVERLVRQFKRLPLASTQPAAAKPGEAPAAEAAPAEAASA